MTSPPEQDERLKALESFIAYRALTHREDQDNIGLSLALKLFPLWTIQRFTELDRSTPLWVSSVLPVVRTAYLQSQRVAAVFAADVRMAALPEEPPLPMELPSVELPEKVPTYRFDSPFIPSEGTEDQPAVKFDEFPTADVSDSLKITGNYNVKAQMPGREEDLMPKGLTNSSGAAMRQAMNGGRNATGNVVRFDRKVIGYARVTDGNPCWYCALLASRGAVFATDSFNKGGRLRFDGVLTKSDRDFKAPKDGPELPSGFSNVAKVHDHCRCQLRPVYKNETSFGRRYEAVRDEEAQFYFDQWEEVTRKNPLLNNRKQLQIFREQYRPYTAKPVAASDIRKELRDRASALTDSGFAQFSPQVEWANAQLSQLA